MSSLCGARSVQGKKGQRGCAHEGGVEAMGGETYRRWVRMRIVFSKMGRQKKDDEWEPGGFQDDQQDPREGQVYGQGQRRPQDSRACNDGRLEHGWREGGEGGRQRTTTKL